ncbi:MAG: Hsp20/alpha crystallin family protein [Phyllobacteriaceae bacterium]|nr:Hsp20/alpha crystallin family protein [Phyllobacteriaceae bacterium]
MNKQVRTPAVQTARPVDLFGRLRSQMDDLFSNFFDEFPSMNLPAAFAGAGFAVDVAESGKDVTVRAELPGIEAGDMTVTVDGASLVIEAEKKAETEEGDKDWHRVERSFGSLRRVVPLGYEPEADAIEAKLDKGVLTVFAPRPAVQTPKAKKVEVKAA